METALFDYPLPLERIAQWPAEPRDAARLLVVARANRRVTHHFFRDLPDLLPPGTRLFRNNAAVFKARLHLRRPTGGQIECLLLHPDLAADSSGNTWWCLLKPGRKYEPGATFGEDRVFTATVLDKQPDGRTLARFRVAQGGVADLAEKLGVVPLPPYIHRDASGAAADSSQDSKSYQTVYADPSKKIAAAAPTAGLHFTPAVIAALVARGVPMYDLALRVGLDTFRPITAERLEDHVIHREWYEIPAATCAALNGPGGPRLAVGTTSLRAMEDYFVKVGTPLRGVRETPGGPGLAGLGSTSQKELAAGGRLGEASLPLQSTPIPSPDQPWLAEANIFIYPPRNFAGAEILLTNFHLPRSTLLCLVSAFLAPGSTDGIAWLKEIYAKAVAHEYRFYSYGDAMLIL